MWEDKSHSFSTGHTMPFAGVTTTLPDSKTLIQNQRHNLVNATGKHLVSSQIFILHILPRKEGIYFRRMANFYDLNFI